MGWQLMMNSWTNNIPLSPIQIGYVFEMLLFKFPFPFPFSLFPFPIRILQDPTISKSKIDKKKEWRVLQRGKTIQRNEKKWKRSERGPEVSEVAGCDWANKATKPTA